MQAHLVQLDIAWEDPNRNFARVLGLLERAPVSPGDLVLLPEMFDTGFSMNTETTADRGLTLGFLADLADDLRVTVQGGRTLHGHGARKAHNVMTIFGPGSEQLGDPQLLGEYAKVHPFSLGGEHERFEGGERVITYRWHGDHEATPRPAISVCPAICYDLRFPELFRIGLSMGAEAFALGACWPRTRQHHWRALLIARAIENQAFVLGCNRTGMDPAGTNGALGRPLEYAGGSIVVSPTGEVLGELGADEGVLSIAVDPGEVRRWREKFPAWKDRRLWSIRV